MDLEKWFSEDDDDIFFGSPKSKLWDIAKNASDDIVRDEFDKIISRYVAVEAMLDDMLENEFDSKLEEYKIKNYEKIEELKKSFYIELTSNIVSRLDS